MIEQIVSMLYAALDSAVAVAILVFLAELGVIGAGFARVALGLHAYRRWRNGK